MPRRQTPFFPGLCYHIYNRGNNRQPIFFQPENYLYFLRGIKKYVLPLARVMAYCLMPTHYHILVQVEQQPSEPPRNPEVRGEAGKSSEFSENSELYSAMISNAMMRLSVSYAKAINKRFDRVGSLLQGQFQAKPIESYAHLLNLCIYVHANPVKDGLVAAPEDWIYSNYREWLGQREGRLVDREFVEENFGSATEYQALVLDYVKTRYLPEDVRESLESLET